jgi:hypothetical protein
MAKMKSGKLCKRLLKSGRRGGRSAGKPNTSVTREAAKLSGK